MGRRIEERYKRAGRMPALQENEVVMSGENRQV